MKPFCVLTFVNKEVPAKFFSWPRFQTHDHSKFNLANSQPISKQNF